MTPLSIVLWALVIQFILGMPIFASLGISAYLALWVSDLLPLSIVPNALFDGVNMFPLLAIPCFIIAGTLMEFGNITNQIIDVVKQLLGRAYGALGMTTIMACMFFAAISGSGPGTVAAVGSILIPAMIRNHYSPSYAAAASASGGTLGILIPPSNPMIIYAILGNLSVTAMFTAGFIPGIIIGLSQMLTAWLIARRYGFRGDPTAKFSMGTFIKTVRASFFALMTPVIILGSIYSGICTPVEASVVAIFWALFVGGVVNRALKLKHLYESLLAGANFCGSVLLIIATSTLFARILTYEEAPVRLAQLVTSISTEPFVVLMLIIAILYLLGMFMETLSTLIILAPVLLPIVTQLGIDPIHFGVILVVTNEVAMLTPPLGVNLFVSSKISNVPVEKVAVSVIPYLLAMTAIIILLAAFPKISTWLPEVLLGYAG